MSDKNHCVTLLASTTSLSDEIITTQLRGFQGEKVPGANQVLPSRQNSYRVAKRRAHRRKIACFTSHFLGEHREKKKRPSPCITKMYVCLGYCVRAQYPLLLLLFTRIAMRSEWRELWPQHLYSHPTQTELGARWSCDPSQAKLNPPMEEQKQDKVNWITN